MAKAEPARGIAVLVCWVEHALFPPGSQLKLGWSQQQGREEGALVVQHWCGGSLLGLPISCICAQGLLPDHARDGGRERMVRPSS